MDGEPALSIAGNTPMLKHILDEGIENRVYTCYAYSVIYKGNIIERGWNGTIGEHSSVEVDDRTLFDLASLTKPLLTATVMAQLVDQGLVHLNNKVSAYLEAFASKKVDVEVGRLLNHTSGLPAHIDLYRWAKNVDQAVNFIANLEPEYQPGTKEVYSDLGYLVLGKLIESVTKSPLRDVGRERVFKPASMYNTMFTPNVAEQTIALTERYTDRPWGPGLVHDENSFFLGGVCGHAGLFSCLSDLENYALRLLTRDKRLFSPNTYTLFLDRSNISIGGEHSYGWFIKNPNSTFFVEGFSEESIGHTGFTGTGIWFDLKMDLCTILLTNRVHFGRDPDGIRKIRAKFNSKALTTLK
ncbi:MAG: serine hydrolase domain-containing protein [Thermoprotei archaeon]